tara:strand:+ start:702 stop:2057 length:1356 start_codon:yes stop_codon:yes gene_type:complete
MKKFSQFVEGKKSTAVFTFGRFNPPTIGHQKLLQAVRKVASQRGGDAHIFGSYSHDKKKNPLNHHQKMRYLKEMFPKEMAGQKPTSGLNTAIEVAVHLNGYENLIMVVGSDRVRDFQTLLDKYNGVEARHGKYDFKVIEVVSAGDRDPDAEGVAGMSASKMRAAAGSGDFESFKLGCPKEYDCTSLYNDVRRGMGISEGVKPFKPVVEMDKQEFVREQYFQNLVYNIGEWVKDNKTGIKGEIVKRGTNYVTVVQEDFALHKIWLDDVIAIEKQRTELPSAMSFIKNRNLWEKFQREARREEGTPALTKAVKKITPNEEFDLRIENAQKLATKFKIPMNVAELVWSKLVSAGFNPLKIQSYASMLTTFMNIMDEKIPEKSIDEYAIGRTVAKVAKAKLVDKLKQKAQDNQQEVAPPGKERVVKALKKKWPDNLKRVYATAWYQYNKEKGKND